MNKESYNKVNVIRLGFTLGINTIGLFLLSVYTAHSLTVEDNGLIAKIITIPLLVGNIASLGIRQSLIYYTGRYAESQSEIKDLLYHVWIATSVLAASISFCLLKLYLHEIGQLSLIIITLTVPLNLFINYSSGMLLGKANYSSYSIITVLPIIITVVTIVILIEFFSYGYFAYFIGQFVGIASTSVLCFKLVGLPHKITSVNFAFIKEVLFRGLKFSLNLLMLNLIYRLDLLILARFESNYEVGIYSKAVQLAQVIWIVPSILTPLLLSKSSRKEIHKNEFSLLIKVSVSFMTIIGVLMFVFGDYLVVALFGYEFVQSGLVIKILFLGVISIGVFKLLNSYVSGDGLPGFYSITIFLGLAMNVGLNLALIPSYGVFGTAIGTLISYIFVFGLGVKLFWKKFYKIHLFRINQTDLILIQEKYKSIKTKIKSS